MYITTSVTSFSLEKNIPLLTILLVTFEAKFHLANYTNCSAGNLGFFYHRRFLLSWLTIIGLIPTLWPSLLWLKPASIALGVTGIRKPLHHVKVIDNDMFTNLLHSARKWTPFSIQQPTLFHQPTHCLLVIFSTKGNSP